MFVDWICSESSHQKEIAESPRFLRRSDFVINAIDNSTFCKFSQNGGLHLIIRNKGDIFEIVNMEIERMEHFWAMNVSKKQVGDWGEKQARDWLVRQGFEVLHHNWRSGHKEIDIIGRQRDVLIFFEVKCRSTSIFAPPETAVNSKKWKNIGIAATDYMIKNKYFGKFRFDILAVTITPYCKQIMHFKDAFDRSKTTLY